MDVFLGLIRALKISISLGISPCWGASVAGDGEPGGLGELPEAEPGEPGELPGLQARREEPQVGRGSKGGPILRLLGLALGGCTIGA